MITPTSALIVEPLLQAPSGALKATSHAGGPAWLVIRILNRPGRPKARDCSVFQGSPPTPISTCRIKGQAVSRDNFFQLPKQRHNRDDRAFIFRCFWTFAMLRPVRLALLFSLLFSLQLPNALAARSLVVTIYLHDDLADMREEQLNTDYVQHWLDEMRNFTHHPIEVVMRRNVQGITDIDYQSMPSGQILDTFTQEIAYLASNQMFSFLNKHLLMTRNPYDKSGLNYLAGLAHFKHNTAIASLSSYSSVAHEIGHMLSATHEDAELKFNGWVCETYTHPRVPARSHCYRYSDRNRANISDYLKYNSN
ncbi:hypothetical protein [Pseudomonas sp. NBRC 111131]|uniref:hypothetical protein n=1 Tax=Pseudomonas sp. NBRC 111131 TaxID=1661046 RepID=UPI00210E8AC9|nr:hypothetical protein [Pseudomonas sp. NBRC 111131]